MSDVLGWPPNGSGALGGPEGAALTDAEVELLLAGAVPVDRADLAQVAAVLEALRAPAMSPALAAAVRRDAGRRRAASTLAAVPVAPAPSREPGDGRRSAPGQVVTRLAVGARRSLGAAAAAAVVLLLAGASRAALPGDLQRVVAAGASLVGWDLPDASAPEDPAVDLGRVGVRRSLDQTGARAADGVVTAPGGGAADTGGAVDGVGRPDGGKPPVAPGEHGQPAAKDAEDATPHEEDGAPDPSRPATPGSGRPTGKDDLAPMVPVTPTPRGQQPTGAGSGR